MIDARSVNKIAVFGAGAYGQELACLIKKINNSLSTANSSWEFIGYFDDNIDLWETDIPYGKVLGGINIVNDYKERLGIVIAIASVNVIKAIRSKISNEYIYFPNIIDPDVSFIDKDTFRLGEGNIIGEGCRFSPDVALGDFNIIVNDSVFGHNVKIGNCNVFFPAVRLSGNVSVGNDNLLGVRSTILQGIEVGSNIKISSGSILMCNAQDGYLYHGNPAKKMPMI